MRENPDERLTGEMILGQENMTFRFAQKEDAALILHFIRELAKYEKRPDQVFATEEMITEWLFEKERAEAFFLVVDGKEIGYALFFHNFSTFSGRGGIYLEDLYVDPAFRGRGYGKASLQQLARIASERGCNRMEWTCLDWNTPSIEFYRRMGAISMDEWTTYRLAGKAVGEAVQK